MFSSISAFAADDDNYYKYFIAPYVGYHWWDGDRDLKDNPELGLYGGYFLQENTAIDLHLGGVPTEDDKDNDTKTMLTYGAGLSQYFDIGMPKLKPYFGIGAGGDTKYMGGYLKGGISYMVTEAAAVNFELRDKILVKGHNNAVAMLGLSYFFGKAPEKKKELPDTDGDGVFDSMDKCPDTPAGVKVNGDGCPLDSDGDGVYDHLDKCPDTPAGTKVDKDGCPIPVDSDKDGVFDDKDQCPDTPEGVEVDEKGCPLDLDGDTVYDYKDKCQGTPGGAYVDADGCIPSFVLDIKFATNSAKIDENYDEDIKGFVSFLQKYPMLKFEIQGHTDSRGSAKYNQMLSEKRAASLMKLLTSKKYGIDKTRMTSKGYGEEKPVADNNTKAGRKKNRRIEVVFEQVAK